MSETLYYDQTVAEAGFDPARLDQTPWSFHEALQQADAALWKRDRGRHKQKRSRR